MRRDETHGVCGGQALQQVQAYVEKGLVCLAPEQRMWELECLAPAQKLTVSKSSSCQMPRWLDCEYEVKVR